MFAIVQNPMSRTYELKEVDINNFSKVRVITKGSCINDYEIPFLLEAFFRQFPKATIESRTSKFRYYVQISKMSDRYKIVYGSNIFFVKDIVDWAEKVLAYNEL